MTNFISRLYFQMARSFKTGVVLIRGLPLSGNCHYIDGPDDCLEGKPLIGAPASGNKLFEYKYSCKGDLPLTAEKHCFDFYNLKDNVNLQRQTSLEEIIAPLRKGWYLNCLFLQL